MTLGDYVLHIMLRHDSPGVPPPKSVVDRAMALMMWVKRDVLKRLKDK